MTNYPAADFLIQLKNAAIVKSRHVSVRETNLVKAIAKTLKDMGYLESLAVEEGKLTVTLAFVKREPVLLNIGIVSKPGLRIYKSADELAKHKKPSRFIVSTPQGVISSSEAIKKRIGGEVIAEIL